MRTLGWGHWAARAAPVESTRLVDAIRQLRLVARTTVHRHTRLRAGPPCRERFVRLSSGDSPDFAPLPRSGTVTRGRSRFGFLLACGALERLSKSLPAQLAVLRVPRAVHEIASPQTACAEQPDSLVCSDDFQAFAQGLGHEHAIERVPVSASQRAGQYCVLGRDG